ncbi:early nodulin-75-like [Homarus americanus]|uniref:early nodulin-75-like n=1 Tax=Homarus americanus TaxID=6706 RepID=UPI001C444BB5|nr:early nodulin-75-like [Homarus americanus]
MWHHIQNAAPFTTTPVRHWPPQQRHVAQYSNARIYNRPATFTTTPVLTPYHDNNNVAPDPQQHPCTQQPRTNRHPHLQPTHEAPRPPQQRHAAPNPPQQPPCSAAPHTFTTTPCGATAPTTAHAAPYHSNMRPYNNAETAPQQPCAPLQQRLLLSQQHGHHSPKQHQLTPPTTNHMRRSPTTTPCGTAPHNAGSPTTTPMRLQPHNKRPTPVAAPQPHNNTM